VARLERHGFPGHFRHCHRLHLVLDAVHRLGAGHASIFINLVPVFAVLQAALLLDERLGLAVLAGGALVIAGVWLTSYQKGKTT
jgi:drug/metabolite transporter (DMT)-like permease